MQLIARKRVKAVNGQRQKDDGPSPKRFEELIRSRFWGEEIQVKELPESDDMRCRFVGMIPAGSKPEEYAFQIWVWRCAKSWFGRVACLSDERFVVYAKTEPSLSMQSVLNHLIQTLASRRAAPDSRFK